MDKLSCIWYTWAALCELNLTVLFLRGACLVLLYDNNSLSHPQTIHHKALSLASQSLNSSGGVHRLLIKAETVQRLSIGWLVPGEPKLQHDPAWIPRPKMENAICTCWILNSHLQAGSTFLEMKWPKIRVRERSQGKRTQTLPSADPLHNTME